MGDRSQRDPKKYERGRDDDGEGDQIAERGRVSEEEEKYSNYDDNGNNYEKLSETGSLEKLGPPAEKY